MAYTYTRRTYALLNDPGTLRTAIANRMDPTGRTAQGPQLPKGTISQFAATTGLSARWPGARVFLQRLLGGQKDSCTPAFAAAVAKAAGVPLDSLFTISGEPRTGRSVLRCAEHLKIR